MIRLVIYFVVIGVLALAATWLADRPGDVVITWQGRHIEIGQAGEAGIELSRPGQKARQRRIAQLQALAGTQLLGDPFQ